MQGRNETDEDACAYNDLALVKVDAAAVGKSTRASRSGAARSVSTPMARIGTQGGGWSHPVYTVTPGVPGDSGSAFLDAEGNALGTLSTLAMAPLAGSNGVGDLNSELSYAQQFGGIAGPQLVPGTEPFSPVL